MEILEQNFSRCYVFHRHQTSHLHYYYLAKKGSLSLFAIPWINTGFFFLFLLFYADLITGSFSFEKNGLLAITIIIGFWLPGLLSIFLFPYQKVWLCLVEEEENLFLSLTCSSPFPWAKWDRIGDAVNRIVKKK